LSASDTRTLSFETGTTMKVAVINFSGNVGKTTVARHLLAPRIDGAQVIAIESINADDGQAQALRGRQFGELQEYLQTVENVVVDMGASNVEELLSLMRKYRGSHEDFDYFVIPTVPALKQQQDTIATLAELTRIGVPASKLKVVFNQVEDDAKVSESFDTLLALSRRTRARRRTRRAGLAPMRSTSASKEPAPGSPNWRATRPTTRLSSSRPRTPPTSSPGRRSSRPVASPPAWCPSSTSALRHSTSGKPVRLAPS
jgi:hypothetical protein